MPATQLRWRLGLSFLVAQGFLVVPVILIAVALRVGPIRKTEARLFSAPIDFPTIAQSTLLRILEMDVKIKMQSAPLWSLVLVASLYHALVDLPSVTADEALAVDHETTSAIFVSDDSVAFVSDDDQVDPSQLLQGGPQASVRGSIAFVQQTPPSKLATVPAVGLRTSSVLQPRPPVVRGDLKVVSNPSRQPYALEALPSPTFQSPQERPAVDTASPIAAQGPSIAAAVGPFAGSESEASQSAMSGSAVLLTAAAEEREQSGDIQIAVHDEPVAPQAAASSTEETALAELLIAAHQLSLQAESAAEYTRIAKACAEAIRLGANHDQRDFAMQLSSWALNRRGQTHADAGDQEGASVDFQAAIDLNSKNWRALHNRGVSFAQSGQFAEAFDDFNVVIQLNPTYAKAYANRATLYVQAKDLTSAIKDYELAIQHDHEFATAHVGLGRVCHLLGRWEEAVEHFGTAVRLAPNSADIVCSRGDLHSDMGFYGEALADYARTIELDAEFAHAYRNGAWLLATCPDEKFRDPENAIRGARQALEYSYGDRHVALDTLAAALASNGQFEEAIQTVTQAVDLAPQDTKYTYLSRLQLYQQREPFRTELVGDVSQVVYEASDE